MAMKPFNSVPGFSVGKGSKTVISANGDVTTGNLQVSQLANLGNINSIVITGGQAGQVITTDGTGNLNFTTITRSQLSNGNSALQVNANGNITFDVSGNSNVVVVTPTGINVSGNISVSSTAFAGNVFANTGIIGAQTLKGEGGNIGNIQGSNVSGAVSSAIVSETVTSSAQPNITSVGTLTSLSVTNKVTAGQIQGDGGNISNIQGANVSGAVAYATTANSVAGANVSGQVNYAAVANSVAGANVSGQVNYAAVANSVAGANVSGAVAYATTANSVSGANVSGQVGNALVAGTVYTSAQPNITSVGTLTSLGVNGTVTAVAFTANTGVFTGNGSGLSAITGANVTGNVPSATAATNASALLQNTSSATTVYPTFTTNSGNGNYSAVLNTAISANLGNASITATTFVGNLSGNATTAGTVTANSQPNITSVGTLSSLSVIGNIGANNITTVNKIIAGNGLQVSTGPLTITNGNLDITGNLNVTGNVNYSNVAELIVQDPLIYIGEDNTGDTFDLGIVASYTEGTYNHTGIARNANDNTWTFFDGVAAEPTTIIDWANATYPNVKMGNLITTSNANIGGIANVTGNVIVGGTLSVTGNANIGNIGATNGVFTNISGNGSALTTLNASNITTGTLAQTRLANSSLTVNGQTISLGSSGTITANTTQTLTLGSYLTGTSFNGGTAVTATVDATTTNTASKIVARDTNGSFSANVITATLSGSATSAGTVTTSAQPNITSIGTLSSLAVSGNITAGNIISPVANGTSNVNIPVANGNINLSAAGNANVVVVTGTGANVTGNLGISGNIISSANGTILGANLVSANFLTGTLITPAQPNITSVGTLSSLVVSGNISAGNIISPVANGNSNVNIPVANGNVNISAAGNANVVVVTGTGANVTGSLSVSGNATVGNIGTTQLFATANIISLQLISNVSSGTAPLLVSSNTLVANLNADLIDGYNTSISVAANTVSVRDANGNISANYFIGDGSQLTGISAGGSSISNGTSNVNIPVANGNVNISAAGNANVVVVTGTGANVTGNLDITGNIISSANGTISGANLVSANFLTGTLITPAQPNITSVGTLTSLTVNGNLTAGNLIGTIAAGSNAITTTGNANVGNLGFGAGIITGTGNISAGNVTVSGQLISTVTTGTPPLIVSSTTQVANLNAATAGTVTTNAQPNITSLGTLTSLVVSGTANLGAIGNVKISGGSNGQFLQTDGSGTLSWQTVSGGASGSISNGTSNVNIPVANGNINLSAAGNANVVVVTGTGANVTGNLGITGNFVAGAGTGGTILGANLVSANFLTGTLITPAQPNITSVGTLSSLVVSGNISAGNVLTDNLRYANGSPYTFSASPGGANTQIQFNNNGTLGGISNVTFDGSKLSLGNVSNVKISGGSNGQFLQTDGTGNLSWKSTFPTVSSVNANTTLALGTGVYFASGPITLTLPDASGNSGATFYIKNMNNQPVTITGINTIDNDANLIISYLNSAITLISDGANWNIF